MRIALLIWLLFLQTAFAETPANYAQANQAMLKGQYNRAIDLYTPLLQEGLESPELFYNLALAYQHINDRGRARAYYEKARSLAPWDADTVHNLGRLRATLDDAEPDQPALRRLAELLPLSWLTVLFAIFHLGMWATLTAYRLRPRELYFWGMAGLASISLILAMLLVVRWTTPSQAAVVPEGILLKNGPGREFTDSVALHAGTMVSVLRREGDWSEVEALGRVRAWLREEEICRVP